MTDSLTVAFELEALDALADPTAVVEDAATWSVVQAIVTDEPAYFAKEYVQAHELPLDRLIVTWLSKRRALEEIAETVETDRHVFVGSTAGAEGYAEALGWEHLPVEVAAEKAGWQLETTDATH